jgi:putative salt-induced outer membrane protein
MLRKGIIVVVVLLMSGVVFAQAAAPAEEESPWSGALSLGYLATSGNTETTSYNTKFGIGYETDKWAHGFNASAVEVRIQLHRE